MNPIHPPDRVEIVNRTGRRAARFGEVRFAVHTNWQGQKCVAGGKQLLNSPNWKTPIDFLGDYLETYPDACMGQNRIGKTTCQPTSDNAVV